MVSRNSLGKKILTYLVIVIALAAFIFPIYWMFIASFKENSILMRVPPQLYPTFKTIDNYISIITNTKYLNYIKNSFVVASLTVIVDLALAIFAGYSLSRYRYPGRKTIMTLTLSAQVFPTVVIIISLYSLFSKLKLMNSYQGLMLADVAMSLPLSVWMMKSFCDSVPKSLDEGEGRRMQPVQDHDADRDSADEARYAGGGHLCLPAILGRLHDRAGGHE